MQDLKKDTQNTIEKIVNTTKGYKT